jgi:hypothetical protein
VVIVLSIQMPRRFPGDARGQNVRQVRVVGVDRADHGVDDDRREHGALRRLLVAHCAREHGDIDGAAEHVGHAFAGAAALDVETHAGIDLLILLRPQADHGQQGKCPRDADRRRGSRRTIRGLTSRCSGSGAGRQPGCDEQGCQNQSGQLLFWHNILSSCCFALDIFSISLR